MTNDELLLAHNDLENLKIFRDQRVKELAKLQADVGVLNHRISEGSNVTDVFNGVCLRVDRSDDGRWCEAYTLASAPGASVNKARLYEAVRTKYWAVCVNSTKDCQHRWPSGKVLGLGKGLSYEQAEAVARRWLLEDTEAVLDIEQWLDMALLA